MSHTIFLEKEGEQLGVVEINLLIDESKTYFLNKACKLEMDYVIDQIDRCHGVSSDVCVGVG